MRDLFDDEAARRALRTMTDEPAPPVATTLDHVLRRGRRRVLVQRASAVAGVVAVVAVIGVGTILLRQDSPGDGLRMADSATVPPSSATTTGSVPAGWTRVPIPASTVRGKGCKQKYEELSRPLDLPLRPESEVRDAFVDAAGKVFGAVLLPPFTEWRDESPKHSAPRGYVVIEVPMGNGNGQLQLEAITYGGTPAEMADVSVTVYGNCGEPYRRVLDDGTIMQLYPVNGTGTRQPSLPLHIYQPDGRMYVVTAAGYSDADRTPIDGGEGAYIMDENAGRGRLPTTTDQLIEIAEALVTDLG